ncbi:3-deoxy-D-manno-octulosonic acid transferase [Polaribacter reichenbachii]|uniref:3-deoxy-D-manno-octulosonic acid transferase n=1 Tax=Polaribacter reichenbachii TaxID=996801 RepID=A0A1B8U623_9FLAO|nr:glycosyltransferase N-terminal domain-containing protein [Polaribacter reichenbachii]APZ46004.1 3-deoxy-D-manno-octulosonic acid transferase [Polaribacter reichenbachii]AUC19866.1 3-deoxy-D-manno-octulosonic acid transferase [Polaribacter reichenbachii]OBY67279.1 3-deoxy-D-manno-octulosonic acid transferase [Polaribacter reichenbachii]
MKVLYDFLIFFTSPILQIIALFNSKIKLFVDGRKETFLKIDTLKNQNTIWFHAASLGEFEQARPIIEELKKDNKQYKILVTFFSPSGYEIRKNYNLADVICYLPLDSKSNAKKFLEIVSPKMVIFIKYEFWPNFLNELKSKEIPTILVSGILREKQLFFKSYGGFMRDSLQAFHYFFVQNKVSKDLLNSINFKNVTVAGDTRFDRVSKILEQDNSLEFINEFKNDKYTVVAGSTWSEGEEFLVNYINNNASKDEKFIIAPHNIKADAILELQKSINKKTVLFSDKSDKNLAKYQVFIIDTIGILTKIYAAADLAYVGGGLKTGLHNILEPATFGIPVVIGDKYDKFKEAVDLVKIGGCISIKNQEEFTEAFINFKNDENFRKLTGAINKKYIATNLGATKLIMNYLKDKI